MITEKEILEAQNMWADGLLKIGLIHKENGDYMNEASNFINRLYNFTIIIQKSNYSTVIFVKAF